MGMVIDPTYTDSRFRFMLVIPISRMAVFSIALCACTMEPNG
jgi:hypothetical protein